MRGAVPTLRDLLHDRSGASALMVGLSLTGLLGLAGLGVDLGMAYHLRREAQHAADSAAFSAAAAAMSTTADAVAEARAVAARYGLAHGAGGVLVTVNAPPASGPHLADTRAVEVIVQRPAVRFLSSLFGNDAGLIRARAVGRAGTVGDACVIALNSTASASALETGKADIKLSGCSLFANSSSPTALELKGGATLTADSVGLVGGYSASNNASLNTVNGVRTGQKPLEDPYADVDVPPYQHRPCTTVGGSGEYGSFDGSPTRYCGGLTINSGDVVRLRPGIHVIDGGQLLVNGGATLTGDGVTLVLTSSSGASYATLNIRGGASVAIKAPSSGAMAGLAIYQDRRASESGKNLLNGGSAQTFTGALYFPRQLVDFTGGSSTTTAGCTQLLASQVAFQGNSTFRLDCAGTGVRMAGGVATSLVE
jgi:Flp pilus assembly protein TadG